MDRILLNICCRLEMRTGNMDESGREFLEGERMSNLWLGYKLWLFSLFLSRSLFPYSVTKCSRSSDGLGRGQEAKTEG